MKKILSKMLNALLTSFLVAGATAKIKYAGVAESGSEFGVYSATATPGTGLPGINLDLCNAQRRGFALLIGT